VRTELMGWGWVFGRTFERGRPRGVTVSIFARQRAVAGGLCDSACSVTDEQMSRLWTL